MDKEQRRRYNEYYIEGSAARQLQRIPNHEVEEEQRVKVQPRRVTRRRPKVNAGIDLFSMMVLTIAIAITLYTCVDYLSVQSGLSTMNKEITDLERDLAKLKDENKAAMSQINTSLDLNYIYQVATTELGMVYPNENQVITYESSLSDYVRQYEEIPEYNEANLLDNILGSFN
jgi:cell division protein FtsL